jgi:hypothetical protein
MRDFVRSEKKHMASKAYLSFSTGPRMTLCLWRRFDSVTKSLTLRARPFCTLAALLGLEVHEYVLAPAGLARVQIRLRE